MSSRLMVMVARLPRLTRSIGRLAALAFGGMIGGRWFVGFDVGLALFALEPVDLVTQALVLLLENTQVSRQILDQIEQTDDQRACAFILNASQIKVIEHRQHHSEASGHSHDYTRLWRVECSISDAWSTLSL